MKTTPPLNGQTVRLKPFDVDESTGDPEVALNGEADNENRGVIPEERRSPAQGLVQASPL